MSEFGKLNLEEIRQEDSRVSTTGAVFLDKFVPMPKPKPGQTAVVQVRILPPRKGGKLFEYTRFHNINGRKVHDPKRLVDGKWDKKEPNPIIDYYNMLWRDADKAEQAGRKEEAERCKAEARSIKPIERYYYNAIVRKMTDENGQVLTNVGPRILSVGKVLHKMIIRAIVGDETEAALGNVTDPEAGYDLFIKVEMRGTGDQAYPNYDRSAFARETSPLGTPEEVKGWVVGMLDLSENHHATPLEVLERELAIHRKLIEDDKEGFSIDKFDQKFTGGGTAANKPRVNADTANPEDLASFVGSIDDSSAEVAAPEEDVTIEDADFIRQMQEMEAEEG